MKTMDFFPPPVELPPPTTPFLVGLWSSIAFPGARVVFGIISGLRRCEEQVRTKTTRRTCRECRASFYVRPYQVTGSRPLKGRRWHLCLDCDLARRCVACGKSFKAPRTAQHQTTCSKACHEERDRMRYKERLAREAEERKKKYAHPMTGKIDMRRSKRGFGSQPRHERL